MLGKILTMTKYVKIWFYWHIFFPSLTPDYPLCAFQSDYDMIDYLNELREGCLEAYTGIVQGLKGDDEQPKRKFTHRPQTGR